MSLEQTTHTQEPSKDSEILSDFYGKDILSLEQFSRQSLGKLFAVTEEMKEIAKNARPSDLLKGNIICLLFYEPSSRTRASFDAAAKQLGGQTIVVENPQQFSSVAKGETFEDSIRTFEAYSDIIVLRHPTIGSAKIAADTAKNVPVINAGDGIGEHPTQAVLDLYTIKEHTGRLSNLTGLVAGDIKNGRTIHSLLKGLALYPGNTAYLLAPDKLKLSPDVVEGFKKGNLNIIEISSPDEIPRECNFWYWTRVQKERFENLAEYEAVNNKFVIDLAFLSKYAGQETILMHPLPRVGEIKEEVDIDPRAVYLRQQIRNGMYTRMALLALILGKV